MSKMSTTRIAMLKFSTNNTSATPKIEEQIEKNFEFRVNLTVLKANLDKIRNNVSDFNITISDNSMLKKLASINEEFDLVSKESKLDELLKYSYSFLQGISSDLGTINQDFIGSYNNFLESFYDASGYKKYSDLDFSKLNRSELISRIKDFSLVSEFKDMFKTFNIEKYSDQAIYLFYITTDPSEPPTSKSVLTDKLNYIQSYCEKNMPKMNELEDEFNPHQFNNLNDLMVSTHEVLDELVAFSSATENDSVNPDTIPSSETTVNLSLS